MSQTNESSSLHIMKKVLKTAFLTALVGGAILCVVGTDRVVALAQQTQEKVLSAIDDRIDARTSLESKIASLEQRLPAELAELRDELRSVEAEGQALATEIAVAERVIELAGEHRVELTGQLARARARHTVGGGALGTPSPSVDSEYLAGRLRQAQSIEGRYARQLEQYQVQVQVLSTQQAHLAQEIAKREAELDEFRERSVALHAEVDTIERNERLLQWMKERSESWTDRSRFEASSLKSLLGSFNEIRERQRTELAALTIESGEQDYESLARREVELAGLAGFGDANGK